MGKGCCLLGSVPKDIISKSLESITLPSTLVEIGDCAFFGCSNLREVIFNEGLQKIGAAAFCGTSLESITLPPRL